MGKVLRRYLAKCAGVQINLLLLYSSSTTVARSNVCRLNGGVS